MALFLISFLDPLLLVYRNLTDFCMLILYPSPLVNLFISSNNFGEKILGFSISQVAVNSNKTFSLFRRFQQIRMIFYVETLYLFFYCLDNYSFL